MPLAFDPEAACRHLSEVDAVMAGLIDRQPAMHIAPRAAASSFAALLSAIVSQQLSVKAAATIHARVRALFDSAQPEPDALLALSDEALRGAGLSGNKTRAVRDLAHKCLDATVPALGDLQALTDAEIIERLTAVRGIGRWTVEMLLIFQLGRPDVLPVGDLGVRRGYQRAYAQAELPAPQELARIGAIWAPYRSVASWYLWRASEAG